MAKKGMKRFEWQHVHPKNEVPPVPELQGKVKHTKEKAPPIMEIRDGQAIWATNEKKTEG